MELRQLRNQMVHKYIEDLTVLADALQASYDNIGFVIKVGESIIRDLEKREFTFERG